MRMPKWIFGIALALAALTALGQVTTNPGVTGVFNPASPGPIGAVAPSTGAFTNITASGTITGNSAMMSPITNAIGAAVALNNTGTWFTGPTVAQGTSGTWFACGSITLADSAGAAEFGVRLTDGTSVIASTVVNTAAVDKYVQVTLCGIKTSPAGNLRMNARDYTSTSGNILYNNSGDSMDSTITAFRIG